MRIRRRRARVRGARGFGLPRDAVIGRVLALCIAERHHDDSLHRLLDALSPAGQAALLAASSSHGVSGCVREALAPMLERSTPLRAALDGMAHRALRDHLRATSALGRVAESLDRLDLPWLTFKGPVLSECFYRRADMREYSDLDLLVPAPERRQVVRALQEAGCALVDPDWTSRSRQGYGEVQLVAPNGTPIDVHWEIANDWRVREAFNLPNAEYLLSRARTVRIDGREILTLDPVDTLLHLALHAVTSGGRRLVWVKDIEQCLLHDGDNWPDVAARAAAWRVEAPLMTMLDRTSRLLDVEVPEYVSGTASARTSWVQFVGLMERCAPLERAGAGPSVTRTVSSCTRPDTASSVRELARRTSAFADVRVRGLLRRTRGDTVAGGP